MSTSKKDRRLDRFRNLIVPEASKSRHLQLPSRYQRLADAVGGDLVGRDEGYFCLIRTLYPYGEMLGNTTLNRTEPSCEYQLSSFSSADTPGAVRAESLLYFDIETTGLGGTGAVPFLIGCGSLTEEGFEVRQYLLPDYSDETALLEAVLKEITDDRVLVSYNGAAFDLTMVRDRMVINRVARELESGGHLDLLHTTRRLFRRRLRDCSLGNIERELLGFHRMDDIPGYLIPAVFFAWLSEERTDELGAVLLHNRLDIFALHFVLELIAETFSSDGSNLRDANDIHSLSRVYDRRKMPKRALEISDRMDAWCGEGISEDILLFKSLALKKTGEWDRAVDIWQALSDSQSREGYFANLELAKYFEHRKRDFQAAYKHSCQARSVCPTGRTHREALSRRLRRLKSKLTY